MRCGPPRAFPAASVPLKQHRRPTRLCREVIRALQTSSKQKALWSAERARGGGEGGGRGGGAREGEGGDGSPVSSRGPGRPARSIASIKP